jgi:uncharacterized protein (DUF433 family)
LENDVNREVSSDHWRSRLDVPAYRVGEAAQYARLSAQTVVNWEKPHNDRSAVLQRRYARAGLSFLQLIEIAVVAAMRADGVKLPAIRAARDFFARRLDSRYPFAQAKFKSDGVDIFQEYEDGDGGILHDRLVMANAKGQLFWTEVLQKRLKEFNYDVKGCVESWKVNGIDGSVYIDPRVSFGAPNISGIATRAIKSRWLVGESLIDIGGDLLLSHEKVIEALIFEGYTDEEIQVKEAWVN